MAFRAETHVSKHHPKVFQEEIITRYRGELSGGEIQWFCRPHLQLRDRAVVIIDDILDEHCEFC